MEVKCQLQTTAASPQKIKKRYPMDRNLLLATAVLKALKKNIYGPT
jgi:hypothetical protein